MLPPSPRAAAENGDWRTYISKDQWARWRPSSRRHESAGFAASLFTSAPSSIWDCETVAKRRRGVVGVATSLFSLHSFFDHLHITPPYTQPPSPTPLSVKERKTDICITSSYCTRFIWNLRVSLERAEEKYFFVEVIFCCLSFFFLSKKKKNSEK